MTPAIRSAQWVTEEFDRRATSYDNSAMHQWQARHVADLLGDEPGQTVLDIATGTGLAIQAVTARSRPSYLVGIDLSEQMLLVAAEKTVGQPCSYARADAHHLPFRNGTFDALLCVAALFYFHNLHQVMQEWRRVARTSAPLVFTTPAADGLTVNRLLRAAARNHGIDLSDPHAALGSEAAIRTFTGPLGLTLERVNVLRFPDPLNTEARAAFDTVVNYNYAETFRNLPKPTRERIFTDYQEAHLSAARSSAGAQDWLFTRCHL